MVATDQAQDTLVSFDSLEVGSQFFDPDSGEDFVKVGSGRAEYLSGGQYFSGQITSFAAGDMVWVA